MLPDFLSRGLRFPPPQRLPRRPPAPPSRARGFAVVAAEVVYEWLHRFNASGFTTFEQPTNPKGRPPIITRPQVRELIDIALSSPAERGLPFSAWTVPKLAEYCRGRGLLPPITDEWVRRLLRREGLRPQRIRTWKPPVTPRSIGKKRNRQLYRHRPPRTAVVSFDE